MVDLQQRRTAVRQRELLLALEQWALAARQGDPLAYVFEFTGASEQERSWLLKHVAQHGMPAPSGRTFEDVRELGRQANAAASAAFLAGDYERARNLTDDAFACGALFEGEWTRLHEFIAARAAAALPAASPALPAAPQSVAGAPPFAAPPPLPAVPQQAPGVVAA